MNATDTEIILLLEENPDADVWSIAETLVDRDVARGEYEGCSSELEMAFIEYEARIIRLGASAS